MCFGYLNHHFVTTVKLVINLFLVYVSIWITERKCFPTVLMCWIHISNYFCFWLSGRSPNIKQYVFLLCEASFCHCCKVGWKLVSDVCEHMDYRKRVFSNCFDVLNPDIKSLLLLVEWKIIINNKCFSYLNHVFLGNYFLVCESISIIERESFPIVFMW